MMTLKIAIAAALIGTGFAAAAIANPAATPAPSGAAAAAPSVPTPKAGHTPMAEEKTPEITPEQRALGVKMIAAINAHDPAAYRQLVAPAALACFNPHNQLYFDHWMARQLKFPVEGEYRLGIVKLDPIHSQGLYLPYRMPPAHDLSISYTAADGSAVTLNRPIVRADGKWYADMPCPTALEMKRLGKTEKKKSGALAHARRLYPKLKNPLKAQLSAMIAKGDLPHAWKLCADSMHVDPYTARALVAILAGKGAQNPAAAAAADAAAPPSQK